MRSGVVGALTATLALLWLQIGLSLFYWLPHPRPGALVAPTWELLGLAGLLLGWRVLRERVPRLRALPAAVDRAFLIGLAALAIAFLFLGFAQGFARREFGYDLVLALHIPYIPALFQMMYDAEPLGRFVLYVCILAAGAALACLAVYVSVRHLYRFAVDSRRRAALAGAVAAYALVAAAAFGVNGPLSAEAYEQLDLALNLDERLDAQARKARLGSVELRRLNPFPNMDERPSIFLFVVESYGAALFAGDPAFAEVEPYVAAQGAALADDGFAVRSRYLEAPVFGGSSWMANASLLCGVRVHNQTRYEALFESAATCLPALLERAGYLTVVAAGNTTFLEDRYARLFPFDRNYFRDSFGYEGPRFGWSYVPDQFVIDFIDDHVVREQPDEPLFVHYQLTSSHHSWSQVPPYFEDWSAIDVAGAAYTRARGRAQVFQNRFVTGAQHKEGYWQTIRYAMTSVLAYVRTLPEDAIILVVGDHQPRRPIADMNEDPWLVPVHVLSRDAAAVERFAELGYAPGLTPPALPDIETHQPGLWDLVRHLFEAYARP